MPVREDKTGDKSLINLAEIYTKSKLNLIHRLDRPSSGLLYLPKRPEYVISSLNEQFCQQVEKIYLAAVRKTKKEEDTLIHFLKELLINNRTYTETEQPGSKRY